MKLQNLSVRAFLRKIVAGTLLTAALLLLIFFLLTKDVRVVICGIILTAAFYIWGMVFLHYFQKKLSLFTDGLCQTLDHMMDSTDRPQVDYEAETLLSRISHRLERLYNVMQKTRHTAEGEKEELQSLVSDISHQTKTPIANLLLYSELLLEDDTDNLSVQMRENIVQIHAQSEKLQFLIASLVKLSRLENGILQLSPQEEALKSMLTLAVKEFKARAKGLELILHDTDEKAYFDSKWTLEAICNILDNALKYTNEGTISLSVTAYEMFVRIDIKDSGIGIKEEELPKIFSRFYRSEDTKNMEGVGIGLYLSRQILSEEGGYIKVSSVYGQGSTFSVFLPKSA